MPALTGYERNARYRDSHPGLRLRDYQKKRDWLDSLKVEPCADCGRSFPPYVMQFDHVRCDLVCANCHAIRTHNLRKVTSPEHGPKAGDEDRG
jgi:hypothetical protein